MFRDPIGYRIKTLSNLMKRNMERQFGPRHDRATFMQGWVIGYLSEREEKGLETFQKDIEEEFSINRSTTSEMLKLMAKRQMISRLPVAKDARLKKIVLTDKSRAIQKHIDDTMRHMYERLTEGLTEEEIATFIVILDKLIVNTEKQ